MMTNDDDCRQQTLASASFLPSFSFHVRSHPASCVVLRSILQTKSNGTWEVNGSSSVHRRRHYHSPIAHDDGPAATAPSDCAVRLYR